MNNEIIINALDLTTRRANNIASRINRTIKSISGEIGYERCLGDIEHELQCIKDSLQLVTEDMAIIIKQISL